MCESESMALVMLEGAASALRRRKPLDQDEEKVKRTLIGEDIPGVRKILPEHKSLGLVPRTGETLLGDA